MNTCRITLFTLIGLVVCSSACVWGANNLETTTPTVAPTIAPKTPETSLDPDTVYSLLTAELAGQRNQLDVSFDNYLDQAKKTKDPTIAERATNIAQQMRDSARILAAAQVWVTVAPDNVEPRTILIQQLSKTNRYNEIGQHVEAILKIKPDADLQAIAMGAEDLTPEYLNQLVTLLSRASAQYPDNISLHLTIARLLMVDKKWDDAQKQIEVVLGKNALQEQALLMQSDIFLNKNQSKLAVEKLHDAITRGADGKRIQLYYGRLLIADKQMEAAKQQFEHIVELYPDDSDLLFTLSLLALDSKLQDIAKTYFEDLLEIGVYESEAHYYLGQISEDENKPDDAMLHYSKVTADSEVYLAALANTALILLKQNKGDLAIEKVQQSRNLNPELSIDLYLIESDLLAKLGRHQAGVTLLTKALTHYKNQPELLYARALAAERVNNIAMAEADLRNLIKQDANDVSALNALGYTLADRTNRIQEALKLITKALALRPDDPAIIDSMGWVQFRLGNYEKSLELLRKSYQKFPDEEIASHLIEVLWVMGKRDDANKVFTEALKENPNSTKLNATIDRLKKSAK